MELFEPWCIPGALEDSAMSGQTLSDGRDSGTYVVDLEVDGITLLDYLFLSLTARGSSRP